MKNPKDEYAPEDFIKELVRLRSNDRRNALTDIYSDLNLSEKKPKELAKIPPKCLTEAILIQATRDYYDNTIQADIVLMSLSLLEDFNYFKYKDNIDETVDPSDIGKKAMLTKWRKKFIKRSSYLKGDYDGEYKSYSFEEILTKNVLDKVVVTLKSAEARYITKVAGRLYFHAEEIVSELVKKENDYFYEVKDSNGKIQFELKRPSLKNRSEVEIEYKTDAVRNEENVAGESTSILDDEIIDNRKTEKDRNIEVLAKKTSKPVEGENKPDDLEVEKDNDKERLMDGAEEILEKLKADDNYGGENPENFTEPKVNNRKTASKGKGLIGLIAGIILIVLVVIVVRHNADSLTSSSAESESLGGQNIQNYEDKLPNGGEFSSTYKSADPNEDIKTSKETSRDKNGTEIVIYTTEIKRPNNSEESKEDAP